MNFFTEVQNDKKGIVDDAARYLENQDIDNKTFYEILAFLYPDKQEFENILNYLYNDAIEYKLTRVFFFVVVEYPMKYM